MPDLLGADPCDGCMAPLIGECNSRSEYTRKENKSFACGPYAAYAARRALLEALKAGGVKVEATPDNDDNWGVSWAWASSALEERYDNHPGTLIFIPEAQGC